MHYQAKLSHSEWFLIAYKTYLSVYCFHQIKISVVRRIYQFVRNSETASKKVMMLKIAALFQQNRVCSVGQIFHCKY